MRKGPGRLLFPALRWDNESGFDASNSIIEQGLRGGVGGFILFGGEADAVAQLTRRTQERCDYELLFGSDLERGAGQQFTGTTQLPPAAAIASLNNPETTARAAMMTAQEARAIGVHWAFAPVADVDVEPRNPIVGTRSFGKTAEDAALQTAAWVRGCHAGGAMACAKHFPGHGRTTEDSHATLPHVSASRATLYDDMQPFRASIREGVDAIMTAHVVFDALDSNNPATLSLRIINDILRNELRFDGLVVTDGMGMQGILDACEGSEAAAGIAAVNAGCDVLLYPTDVGALLDAVNAEHGRRLSRVRVEQAIERIGSAAATAHARPAPRIDADNEQWSLDVAYKSVQSLGDSPEVTRAFDLLTIDDDLGGPHPAPARNVFVDSLRAAGLEPEEVRALSDDRPAVVAVYADIRAWKGAPGPSKAARESLDTALRARRDATVVLFAHPRLADGLGARHVVAAWGGEAIMQRAAAAWLANSSGRR